MSHIQSLESAAADAPLRVRDQAREVLVLIAFSAATASASTLALMLLLQLGQRG
ncbi:hypothetical protein [Nocardioides seonyuensis]|uniref:hypothetical protein n=1 Tax=Nocardioides seonyuensis TaxID=2518371 RepID=UPI0014244944|nr:hypothetical protein [Nocardioides seonyuensis]